MEISSSCLLLSLPPSSLTTSPSSKRSSFVPCCYYTNSKRNTNTNWNSNAESSRFKFGAEPLGENENGFGFGKQKRRWWSDEEEDEEDDDNGYGGGGIVEEAIDSIWIFKVFRTFGWLLPFIIASMLLATGPKAFFMALALPLGQSALSLAIDKVLGKTRNKPKPRYRTKRKPFARAATDVETEEEDLDGISGTNDGRPGYQSWVATANDDSVKKKSNDQRIPDFGGWEELDKRQESNKESRRKSRPRQSVERGKLSRRRGRQKDTPLFFRFLVAVFPFLGSWTRLF